MFPVIYSALYATCIGRPESIFRAEGMRISALKICRFPISFNLPSLKTHRDKIANSVGRRAIPGFTYPLS